MAVLRDAQPLEQLGGVALGVPAPQFGELRLQFAGPDAVLIGEILLGVKGVLLHRDIVEPGVAQDHRLQHLLVIVLELVLLQDRHPQVLGDDHLPGGGLQLPGEYLQEGGFAGAVGPDDAVAVAGGELEGGPRKKFLPPKGETDVGNCDQFWRPPMMVI